ncbi:AAA family ATPase [Cryobacterium sp. SO2]|uniref:TrlF family AAA-like ATPase n=1 Tax=Cryobacterium sp. SO2 TaxID=1897060 RepID=UPI00223E26F8|nr:AAA family ATPase [Cryobacterium sp. SO2]WEO76087.1 AAA family ATPase [Cryobacterium sp. SO2]
MSEVDQDVLETVPPNKVGASWFRAALQINPYSYKGKAQPSRIFASENDYNTALLDRCEAQGISIIAITDHWSVDSALQLVADAESRGIVALPGFEANSSEGIHLLVIFEAGTRPGLINAAIGKCGGVPGQDSATGDSYSRILTEMAAMGALVIPAHANVASSGLLTGRGGLSLVEMVMHSDLHAIGITPSVGEAGQQKAIFRRQPPFDRQYPIAMIYSDDVCHPDTLLKPGGSTWFKMSRRSLAGIKHAVHIPSTRVSVVDPKSSPRAIIREVSWQGGFIDGVTLTLPDDMTNLIGGRGTGKSTIVESLRFVLEIDPLGAAARSDHDGIVKHVLGVGTTVSLVVEAISPTADRYTIQRTVPGPAVVLDSSGTATDLRPEDVVGSVEIYGQHELAELANDNTAVAAMLHRFNPSNGAQTDRKDLVEKLVDNRERFDRAEGDRERLEDELADLDRLQAQADRFKDTDVAKRLEDLRRLQQDDSVFKEVGDRVAEADKAIAEIAAGDLLTTLASSIELIDESPQKVTLQRAAAAGQALGVAIRAAIEALKAAAADAKLELAGAKDEWEAATAGEKAAHDEVLRELRVGGLEPEKYLTVSGQLETLKTKAQRIPASDKLLKDLAKERASLVRQLQVNQTAMAKHLLDTIRDANKATSKAINLRAVQSSDRRELIALVKSNTVGQRSTIMAALEDENFSVAQFVMAARVGAVDLERLYSIKGAQANALINAGEPLFRKLEECCIDQAVDVYLDTSSGAGAATFRRLDQLSKGQRATALLMLLLGFSSSPLVIDQPEDDLDNRFVFREIVKRLRKLKGHRQIIASTHNANIPVLGDAELIVVLAGDGSRAWVAAQGLGSLDEPAILAHAEDLLEGGRDAFNDRKHLYGF